MSYDYITMPLLAVHSDGERIVKQVAIHQQQLRIRCHLCPSVNIRLSVWFPLSEARCSHRNRRRRVHYRSSWGARVAQTKSTARFLSSAFARCRIRSRQPLGKLFASACSHRGPHVLCRAYLRQPRGATHALQHGRIGSPRPVGVVSVLVKQATP